MFYQLQKHIKENDNVVSTEAKRLQQYVPELETGKNILYYDVKLNLNDALNGLRKDIEKAESRIIVSLPSGNLLDETSNEILQLLQSAQKRGIQILMKSREYEALPKEWQNFCYQSTNAVFPVIAVDNKVVWYGLPVAKWMFENKDGGFGTVYPMVYRIKGEHTVELIHSLSSLEIKEVDGKEKALQEKTSVEDSKGISDTGFPKYVKNNYKCPQCKSPMEMLRNQKKVCYLRCSNRKICKYMDYVREAVVNSYIWNENARCPKHNCEVYAKRGPYGVYVVCEEGGHNLKPDEI